MEARLKLNVFLSFALLAASPALAAPYAFTPLPSGFSAAALNNVGQVAGVALQHPGGFLAPAVYANGTVTFPGVPPSNGFSSSLTGINDAGDLLGETLNGRSPFTVFGGVIGGVAAPGGTSAGTQAFGLNNARQVVGSASIPTGQGPFVESYVSSGSSYAVIVVPGQAITNARAINNAGVVVGSFGPALGVFGPAPLYQQGFLDQGGTFTTISVPGAVETIPLAINDAGEIAGTYRAADGSSHGFTDFGGVFSDVTGPDGAAFLPVGLNNAGQLVGTFGGTGLSYLATPAAAPAAVPEPASLALLGGLAALSAAVRRRCGPQHQPALCGSCP